jgi:outer membrane protein assembly factor BamD (BamD/ComL family)
MKIWSISICCGVGLLVGGCASIESQWQATQQQGTVAAYRTFVTQHPNANQAAIAREIISDEEAFDHATDSGTSAAMEVYLKRFPSGRHVDQAHKTDESLAYKEAVLANSSAAMETYLRRFPSGTHVGDAQKTDESLAYKEAVVANSIDAMERFLAHFPNSSFSSEVLAKLRPLRFQKAQQSVDDKLREQFLKQYPGGKDSDELRRYLHLKRLGEMVVSMFPSELYLTFNQFTGEHTPHRSHPASYNETATLTEMRQLLEAGADPNAVWISGYSADHWIQEGAARTFSAGNEGHVVFAGENGITLVDYCKRNGFSEAEQLLRQHGGHQ